MTNKSMWLKMSGFHYFTTSSSLLFVLGFDSVVAKQQQHVQIPSRICSSGDNIHKKKKVPDIVCNVGAYV